MAYPVKINGIWTLNGVQLLDRGSDWTGSFWIQTYQVTGTSGNDRIELSDWFGTPALFFSAQYNQKVMYSSGGAGNDTIHGTGYYDIMVGGAGDDWLYGGGGSPGDSISGGEGGDHIYGQSAGTNNLSGDSGIDTITGGTGTDYIYGGTEKDMTLPPSFIQS